MPESPTAKPPDTARPPGSLEDYLSLRYGSPDQGLIHRREMHVLRRLLLGLNTPPVQSCLDAPCGPGRLAGLLGEVLAPSLLVNADRSWERLRAVPAAAGPIRQVSLNLLKSLPFADESFDLVVSIRYLQHVRNGEQRRHVLGEFLRVARRFLVVSYYDAGGIHGTLRGVQRKLGIRGGAPLATLSPAAFADEVEILGGTVVSDRAMLPWVHAHRVAVVRKVLEVTRV